ncbi:copia protein [Tanacetum coccineum]
MSRSCVSSKEVPLWFKACFTRTDVACLLLYVDDIILVTSTVALRTSLISLSDREFVMKDHGPLSSFLGVLVTQHSHGLFLSQQNYARYIISRVGMSSCNPVHTPVDTKGKLSVNSGKPYSNPTHFRSHAGALQYLTFTRPNSSYTHLTWCATHNLVAYIDADWGSWRYTRRSTSGYCVFMGDNLNSLSSIRQATLSCSSSEAEYHGVAHVVSESCWLRTLLLELHCPIPKATLMFFDNVSAIFLLGNLVQHRCTKHIEMDIHFVCEKVARGQVRVLHVPIRFQIADIFTKGLPHVLFGEF